MNRERPKHLKKAGGKDLLRWGVILLLLAVFAVSGANVIRELWDYRQGEETYSEAEELADLPDLSLLHTPSPTPTPTSTPTPPAPTENTPDAPEKSPAPTPTPVPTPTPTPYVDPYADALSAMDFAALREVNGDVVGWIVIPGTAVSYPLLQGEDNDYYLRHTWKGKRNSVGTIFLEHTNSADLSDFHTLVYGHHMKNGSMFGSLLKYSDPDYLAAHPSVYLTVDGGTFRYEIFAVYEAGVDSNTYQIGFSGEEDRERFLADCAARSQLETGVTPHPWDRVLTLSTCTPVGGKETRWVVQAVWAGEPPQESPPPEETPPAGEETPSQETPARSPGEE